MAERDDKPDQEIARRRDETIKRMFATPPKKHKSEGPKRPAKAKKKAGPRTRKSG